jgi:uncharacterized protein
MTTADQIHPSVALTPTRLVVVQATPFCNLDCKYCYLPNRSDTSRISAATLDQIVHRLEEWAQFENQITIVWHAGEPLVLNADFYADAIPRFDRLKSVGLNVGHAIQTNATLVTEAHCEVFRHHDVKVCVSVDGPSDHHDAFRVLRSGAGTHASVMKGLDRLLANNLTSSVISVVSSKTMQEADRFYDFFAKLPVKIVGFNIQEREGESRQSVVVDQAVTAELYKNFVRRIFERSLRENGPIFRELVHVVNIIERGTNAEENIEATPGSILAFTSDGRFGSYSPELLGIGSSRYGEMTTGDIWSETINHTLIKYSNSLIGSDIREGVRACSESCSYYAVCGGGSPANKLGEAGRMDVTETLHCKYTRQIMTDVVVELLEDSDLRTRAREQLTTWRQM